MEANVNHEQTHAFVVKLADAKKVWDLFHSCIGSVSAGIKCADGIERKFNDWKQLKSFDNPPQKQIRKLSLAARSKNFDKSAELTLSNNYWQTIGLRISGTEQVVSKLYSDVRDALDGMRPWYSMLTRFKSGYVFAFVCFFALVVLSLTNSSQKSKNIKLNITAGKIILALLIVGIIVASIIFLAWLLNKVHERYFPVATFALGQGEERYRLAEKVRWVIVVGFIVSLSASLLVAFFI